MVFLHDLGFCSPLLDRANRGMLGFRSRHRQALRLSEPFACLRKFFNAWDSACLRVVEQILECLASGLTIKQALRLGEPLHALEDISMIGDSARLRAVEQILACLASVSP